MSRSLLKTPRQSTRVGRLQRRRERAAQQQIPHGAPPAVSIATYFRWKHWLDRTLAALLLIVALPIIALCGLAVLLTCGRPVFYCQQRSGYRGRTFTMYKIRTMRANAESHSGAVWSPRNDCRVTFLGRFLRASHLDELPQLLNVLRGDMNLIGPRPERPAIVHQLVSEIPDYTDRLLVPPGITGLAQVWLPSDTSLRDVQRKLVLDVHYVQAATWRMDLNILVRTVPHLFLLRAGKGSPAAVGRRLLRNGLALSPLASLAAPACDAAESEQQSAAVQQVA